MRLYDALMHREEVIVADNDGHLLASDRYVAIDLRHTTGPAPTSPGVWKVTAGRAPAPVKKPVSPPDDPAPGYRAILAQDADWRPVTWSDYIRTFEGHPYARIGSLAGEPVAVNAAWLSRLPADYEIQAHAHDKPMRIYLKTLHTMTCVGVVMPIRITLPEWLRPTDAQRRNRRLDEQIASAHA